MKKEIPYSREEAHILLAGEEKVAYQVFKQVYDEYAGSIYVAARQFLKSPDMAKDLLQEIFSSVWLLRRKLSGINNFESYLFGIAKNMAYDMIKRALKDEVANLEYHAWVDANHNASKEKYENQLHEIVEQLPSKRKQIFRMAKIEGLKYEVIAERLKISTHTVNHNITLALKFIHERKHDVITVVVLMIGF